MSASPRLKSCGQHAGHGGCCQGESSAARQRDDALCAGRSERASTGKRTPPPSSWLEAPPAHSDYIYRMEQRAVRAGLQRHSRVARGGCTGGAETYLEAKNSLAVGVKARKRLAEVIRGRLHLSVLYAARCRDRILVPGPVDRPSQPVWASRAFVETFLPRNHGGNHPVHTGPRLGR